MKKLSLAFVCLVLVSCEKTIIREENPLAKNASGGSLQVFAFIATWPGYQDTTLYGDADVLVRTYSTVPLITINGIEPNNPYWCDFDYNDIVFQPGTACSLNVQVGDDHVSGIVHVPKKILLMEPANDAVVAGRDLVARWSDAHADQYDLYASYVYEDYNGRYVWRDTVLQNIRDTSATLTDFLPDQVLVRSWFYGYVEPMASNGPPLVPGTPGNLSGDGGGFMWAYYYNYGSYFNLAGAGSIQKDRLPREDLAYQCRQKHTAAIQRLLNSPDGQTVSLAD